MDLAEDWLWDMGVCNSQVPFNKVNRNHVGCLPSGSQLGTCAHGISESYLSSYKTSGFISFEENLGTVEVME